MRCARAAYAVWRVRSLFEFIVMDRHNFLRLRWGRRAWRRDSFSFEFQLWLRASFQRPAEDPIMVAATCLEDHPDHPASRPVADGFFGLAGPRSTSLSSRALLNVRMASRRLLHRWQAWHRIVEERRKPRRRASTTGGWHAG